MSFQNLKKSSGSSAIAGLVARAEALGGGGKKDYNAGAEEYWQPTVDKAGNGYAVIRFLPAPANEDLPWVQWWDHGFKDEKTGRWYIEKSLTTLGQPDPLSEANQILWNSGREEDKDLVRKRKRKLHYVSNIEVVSDSGNPANDGKVFKFKYGKKIYDKLIDVMQPDPKFGEEPINPFDFWAGADFKLKITNVEGYRNYDKSGFAAPKPHRGGDEKQLEEIYNSLYSLAALVAPSEFKSYDELKTKLNLVLGVSAAQQYSPAQTAALDEYRAPAQARSAPEPSYASADIEEGEDADAPDTGADTLSYFARLAKGEE